MVSFIALLSLVLNIFANVCLGGITSSFVRKFDESEDMPLDSDVFRAPPGYNAPQQVHIMQGDHVGKSVIVSWVTMSEPGSNTILYWLESNPKHKLKAKGTLTKYKFYNYTSGYIHHCTINNLQFDTKYYYQVGLGYGQATRIFWFKTPPEVGPDGEPEPFKPYTSRYPVPYKASNSTSPLWYSIKRASAHIIVLSSYSAFGKYTPQYLWLGAEFRKVNRKETPWLIVLVHSPFYNSYQYHYMEGETMRVLFEPWFVKYKVDIVFAGHVHAYERSERISNSAYNIVNGECTPVNDQSAPVYITIGDGGNIEGLATVMTEPQPEYSAFREASFGHATLEIKNRSHAFYSWHRNDDGYSVKADSKWFYNRYWNPIDETVASA
ncbi:purple acid phosphatase [Striga asiatica]|uniref:Purple acid phosphatase n=1 Tax=Striga asiatica TaxID=4170 RepID=A0A5A7R233_STRAF|nr:purple acid phosphatase [Striga asiatica]